MLIHRIAHWLGWTTGNVYTWVGASGHLWVAYRCDKCGRLDGVHIAQYAGEFER